MYSFGNAYRKILMYAD